MSGKRTNSLFKKQAATPKDSSINGRSVVDPKKLRTTLTTLQNQMTGLCNNSVSYRYDESSSNQQQPFDDSYINVMKSSPDDDSLNLAEQSYCSHNLNGVEQDFSLAPRSNFLIEGSSIQLINGEPLEQHSLGSNFVSQRQEIFSLVDHFLKSQVSKARRKHKKTQLQNHCLRSSKKYRKNQKRLVILNYSKKDKDDERKSNMLERRSNSRVRATQTMKSGIITPNCKRCSMTNHKCHQSIIKQRKFID